MNIAKKWIFGCLMVSAAVFLCIPTMAGGYSARSELKVNILGLCPCPGELGLAEELLLEQEPEEEIENKVFVATPSKATKSNTTRFNATNSNAEAREF